MLFHVLPVTPILLVYLNVMFSVFAVGACPPRAQQGAGLWRNHQKAAHCGAG